MNLLLSGGTMRFSRTPLHSVSYINTQSAHRNNFMDVLTHALQLRNIQSVQSHVHKRLLLHLKQIYFQIFKSKHNNSVYFKGLKVFQVTRRPANTDTHSHTVHVRYAGLYRVKINYENPVRAEWKQS